MIYDIKKDIALDLSGYVLKTTTNNGANFKDIPKFWDDLMKDSKFQKLLPLADDLGVIGVCYNYDKETDTFLYMIGVNNASVSGEDMKHISFPKMNYAAFEAKGKLPTSIQKLVPQLGSFIKEAHLEYGDGPELEVYPDGDMDSDDYISYYWVPIK